MSTDMISVLLVEDNPGDVRLIREEIKSAAGVRIQLQAVGRLDAALDELDKNAYDVLLLDLMLPDSKGLDTVRRAHAHSPDIPIVLLTGLDDQSIGLEAIQCGAQDYLVKGKADSDLLVRSLRHALERRRVEDALRQSEERFRSFAENASEAIVVLDSTASIDYWNRAAERIFGYGEQEVRGRPMSMLFPESRRESNGQVLDPTLGNQDVWMQAKVLEEEGLRKNGGSFPMVLSLASWEVRGERFFGAVIRDMTEIWEARQKAYLQDRLAAVGQLASGIAHDFNNILGTITLLTEMLQKSKRLGKKDLERLGLIRQQAHRAAALISQILDFSRRSVMEMQPMDLVPFLDSVRELLKRTIPSNILITLTCDEDKFVVKGDPTRMQQMIMNLALNSRYAMPDGGKLLIHLSRLTTSEGDPPVFRDMPPGTWLRLEVSDTGDGIPTEALPHVFEPFYTTKPFGEGTGLGLAQVYGIVKHHEGYIDVASIEGQGTTFIIYVPLWQGEVEEAIPEAVPISSEIGRGETILVVEDDPATRQVMGELLEDLAFQSVLAADGLDALRILEERGDKVDLVISDLVMPGMGGGELRDEIRSRFPHVPVVFMTGHPMEVKTQRMLEGGDVMWFQKPLDSETLLKAIRKVLP